MKILITDEKCVVEGSSIDILSSVATLLHKMYEMGSIKKEQIEMLCEAVTKTDEEIDSEVRKMIKNNKDKVRTRLQELIKAKHASSEDLDKIIDEFFKEMEDE